jgi:hypothetical protein
MNIGVVLNPTIVSYNARAVKIYYATISLVRLKKTHFPQPTYFKNALV